MQLPDSWLNPPREFSVMPFWFWNDDLDEHDILRQIADFEAHGVYGFVIHPRVGLPRSLAWMSDRLLHFYHVAIAEARRRGMYVLLYDEGMYPSGSSSGQVVASNPDFQTRCLAKIDLADGREPALDGDEHLVAVLRRPNGQLMAVVDRKANSFIRGLHYVGEGPQEDEPPAADLLNPAAVARFIELVYDRFAEHFSAYFGNTIMAIFTDEPNLLGRCRERGIVPGTTGILEHVNRILGYDFTPHLAALWYDDEPNADRFRDDYRRAVNARLEETYYAQLYAWCEQHNLPLTGHPARADEIGILRYFHIPGQDLVWRWVLPDHPSALEGAESTQGKCSSSAMIHNGRRRNSNECCGAYGHELTWDEMTWLAHWCFVRGVNLLYPHAFYYSVRGPRRDERPPDVGPHSAWWDRYRQYADACRRLSYLNTNCTHICDTAILCKSHHLPWKAAKVCFEHQRDFNYLEERYLSPASQDRRDVTSRQATTRRANPAFPKVDDEGIHFAGMHYRAVIVEDEPHPQVQPALETLEQAGRVIHYRNSMDDDLITRVAAIVPPDIGVSPPAPGLRVRHIVKDGIHCYMLFNERKEALEARLSLSVHGPMALFDVWTGQVTDIEPDPLLRLEGHAFLALLVRG